MDFYQELENDIKNAYEQNTSAEEAERLAAKFLLAQLEVGRELAAVDLDSRNKKTGVKAFKAVVYLENVAKNEKKPSDVLLQAIVDSDKLVCQEQAAYDAAEVNRNKLENYLNVFRDAHIYFRGIAKGKFE